MHYFQFNIGDYASHTRHLSLMEDLAYRRMLDCYYLREQPLPVNPDEVARLIGMRDHVAEVTQVLNDFFTEYDYSWHHARADAEIIHFRDKSMKASNAGKASAQRRSNKRSTDVQPTNNQEPITINQEPNIEPNGSCASGDAPLTVNEVLENWNEVAGDLGLAKVRKLTDARRRKLQSQIRRFPLDDWLVVFRKIGQSSFLKGDNRNGWRCDFDFILSEANFVKILEGKYDRQAAGSTN